MAGLKRTAEIQLTREEEVDDEEIMEIAPPEGFQKADANVLASRPMKGLPKRVSDAPSSKSLESGTGLNPFGLPSSPFTFSKPTPPSTPQTEQPAPAGAPFKFSAPAVSPSATATTKLMSNIMASLPQPNGIHTNTPTEASSSRYKDDADMTYYASLRGLNESVRSFIDELLKDEPYADLSAALYDQYKEYRSNIQKEYESKKSRAATRVNGVATASSSSSKPVSTSQEGSAVALSMPTPPKAFSFGGSSVVISPSNSTAPGPAVGGFKPDFAAISSSSTTPSVFTLPSSSTSGAKDASSSSNVRSSFSSTMPAKSSPFGGASSSFTFGSMSSSNADKPVGSTSSSATDKPFGSTSSNTTDKLFAPFGSGSGFGSTSVFGKPGVTSAASSSANGSGSTGGFTLGPAFGSSGLNTSGFKFGSPSSTSFAFGSKAMSGDSKDSGTAETSEPVASSSKPVTTSPSSSGDQDTAGTTANSDAPASTASAVSSAPASNGTGEGTDAPAEDNVVSKLLGENPNDLEGEGEEDEETLISARVKIFRFMKKGQEPGWVEFGVGMLRVKKHKKNGSFRLLSRNSANGKIMMNFKLYAGFKLSRAKNILNFMGHDNGEGAMFRVRVKDEPSAAAVQETVEKAVSTLNA